MASESFVLVLNIHQRCCKSFCQRRTRGLHFTITPPPKHNPATLLQKASLNLSLPFYAGSALLLLLLHFPAVRIFFVGIHLLCCHGATEKSEREAEEERWKKWKERNNSTSFQPLVSLWDVTIHSLRYRSRGVGDSCLLTSG